MDKKQFYEAFADIVEADPASISGSKNLKEVEGWDSLAAVGFLAMADKEFQTRVDPSKLQKCNTVDDLAALFGDKISD